MYIADTVVASQVLTTANTLQLQRLQNLMRWSAGISSTLRMQTEAEVEVILEPSLKSGTKVRRGFGGYFRAISAFKYVGEGEL